MGSDWYNVGPTCLYTSRLTGPRWFVALQPVMGPSPGSYLDRTRDETVARSDPKWRLYPHRTREDCSRSDPGSSLNPLLLSYFPTLKEKSGEE